MFMSVTRKVSLIVLLGLLALPWLPAAGKENVPVFRLGTASPGGAYHDFGNDLIGNLERRDGAGFRLINVPTEGSLDNLERIRRRELDLAIVQNDIAYYVYEGRHGYSSFKGFAAVLPLFQEYVQVLVRGDSDIRILGDLGNKRISVGPRRSGNYHNAMDLLREIGLRSGIDYEASYLPVGRAMERLSNGTMDAVLYTGAALPLHEGNRLRNLRLIPVSREVIASLKARSSYYSSVEMADGRGFDTVPTVGVQAYLVAGNHLGTRQVQGIVEAIAGIWRDLKAGSRYRLGALEEIARRSPVPLHDGVDRFLRKAGYIESSYLGYLWFVLASMLSVGVVFWAYRTTSGYDRLGNIRVGAGSLSYRVAVQISRIGTLVLTLAIVVGITVALVSAIRYAEMNYAREMNINNEFINVDFFDALLWMFMFMGAGEPGDMFPVSTTGKILATILPFLGITSVLGFFFMMMERQRRLAAERKRGTVTGNVQNHVLICGWNEKVPGLVWALTNKDAPERKKVVVVAELDGDMPLERYHFDPGLVSYCRGDSADHGVLKRAQVGRAEAAVVVAGLRKRKGRNIRSVLSVMALKKAYKTNRNAESSAGDDLFVAAEMIYDENQVYFEASRVDAVVPSENIADLMAALCCTSPSALDYMLDMFTYDDHAEIYSIRENRVRLRRFAAGCPDWIKWKPVQRFLSAPGREKAALVGRRLAELRGQLAAQGVNLIGLVEASYKRAPGVIGQEFREDGPYKLLLGTDDGGPRIGPGDTLLYIADDYDDIHLNSASRPGKWPPTVSRPVADRLWHPVRKRVLLAGDLQRCLRVKRLLEDAPWIEAAILTENPGAGNGSGVYRGKLSEKNSWARAGLAETALVLVLANSTETTREIDLTADQGEVDARAILAAQLARKFFHELVPDRSPDALQVIAEMAGHNSRRLFKDAGVDVIIPSNLLVERALTKLVYSRGVVCEFLMALLSMKDQVHLYSFRLEEGRHGELFGKTFGDLMEIMPEGFQLIGLLPGCEDDRIGLNNEEGDFDHHFIACPETKEAGAYRTKAGDELIVIIDRRRLQAWNRPRRH